MVPMLLDKGYDVVGLDTLVHTANGVYDNCPNDEKREVFQLPDFINTMMENKWLGSKTGQGFYKKSVDANGKKEILTLDLDTMEYRSKKKASKKSVGKTSKKKTSKSA